MHKVEAIRPKLFSQCDDVVAAMSTRHGGVSPEPLGMNLSFSVGDDEQNVMRNRELFFSQFDIQLDELAIPKQIHSSTVKYVQHGGAVNDCDGLVTDCRRVFLCVSIADCVPVLLHDPKRRLVAGIHAGWRGTADRIVMRGLELMVNQLSSNPSDIRAFIGPSASTCCYEVDEPVASRFEPRHVSRQQGKIIVDLKQANCDQLMQLGVPGKQIEVDPRCTISSHDLFHSYRRDKQNSGRMMAVVGLK